MNTRIHPALLSLLLATAPAPALAESFTYRGYLEDAGLPAEGRYDLKLTLYADAQGKHVLSAPIELQNVAMVEGSFAVSVDVPGLPPHLERGWLQVAVKSPDDGAWWPLPERSEVMLKGATCPASWALAGNAGTSASTNFVGTTDGVPLVLRSAAGVGINTTGVRGMLTVRGPDDFNTGPVIHLAGNSTSQFESGRIRFVNGTAAGNYRGFYMHYDGSGNFFHIGGRDIGASSQDPADDRNIITLRRSEPTRVGIGNDNPQTTLDVAGTVRAGRIGIGTASPVELLEVRGNIGVLGRIMFRGDSHHFLTFHARHFSSEHQLNGNLCVRRFGGLAKRPFQASSCVAVHALNLPKFAHITQVQARITQGQGSGASCGANISFGTFNDGFPTPPELLTARAPSDTQAPTATITVSSPVVSRRVSNETDLLQITVFSSHDDCAVEQVRISYTMPLGFLP
jgi:hypothetical protein